MISRMDISESMNCCSIQILIHDEVWTFAQYVMNWWEWKICQFYLRTHHQFKVEPNTHQTWLWKLSEDILPILSYMVNETAFRNFRCSDRSPNAHNEKQTNVQVHKIAKPLFCNLLGQNTVNDMNQSPLCFDVFGLDFRFTRVGNHFENGIG